MRFKDILNKNLLDAVTERNVEEVQRCLSDGADPNTILGEDHVWTGGTVLMYAASNNDVSIMEELLKAKANPNKADGWGNTPLIIATTRKQIEAVKCLLNHGVNKHLKNKNGETVFDLIQKIEHMPPALAKMLSDLILNSPEIAPAADEGGGAEQIADNRGGAKLEIGEDW